MVTFYGSLNFYTFLTHLVHSFTGILLTSKLKLSLTLSGPGWWNPPSPFGFFLHNSKTPQDIENKLSDFNFTTLAVILHILLITIVIRCCHSNFLFSVSHIFFWDEKQGNLNYFQDDYLIRLKFGI